MLKNRYEEILVGRSLMSLVRGLISLKRNRTTLLIDDYRFSGDSYPLHFLSELEILAILRIGKQYDIPELKDLRQFLISSQLAFVTDKWRLMSGRTPYQNLKELLRKFPELLDANDLDEVFAFSAGEFDSFFLGELKRYEELSYEAGQRPKGMRFDLQGPRWFKTIYERLGKMLNEEYQGTKDLKFLSLLHLLGIASEEKLKAHLYPEELPFYFFRLLSPIYRLQDFFLITQLKRRLLLLGGDYKESTVQFWQFHEQKFENLLLSSFEGVISGKRVLFFSHLPEEVPFGLKSPYPLFRKTQMAPQKRVNHLFPPTSLTFMASLDSLGSERPFRVLAHSSTEMSYFHWPYPEQPGSKAEFYEKDLQEAFNSDARDLPFDAGQVTAQGTLSVCLDLRQLRAPKKSEAPNLTRLPLSVAIQDQEIQGFEYWGPFRYKSLGLLSLCYGVEGI